jgi:hypothetical protein
LEQGQSLVLHPQQQPQRLLPLPLLLLLQPQQQLVVKKTASKMTRMMVKIVEAGFASHENDQASDEAASFRVLQVQ